mmetsp:Transcript_13254/g.34436  ORF Transcript_13254/g.34436 Transcript_13254/m.34436 type:complete len:206 (+) Transcript_13254:1184-1801(+)
MMLHTGEVQMRAYGIRVSDCGGPRQAHQHHVNLHVVRITKTCRLLKFLWIAARRRPRGDGSGHHGSGDSGGARGLRLGFGGGSGGLRGRRRRDLQAPGARAGEHGQLLHGVLHERAEVALFVRVPQHHRAGHRLRQLKAVRDRRSHRCQGLRCRGAEGQFDGQAPQVGTHRSLDDLLSRSHGWARRVLFGFFGNVFAESNLIQDR